MQQQNKGLRLKTAATSEKGEDNLQQHQRTKQETRAMTGKREDILWCSWKNHYAGDQEANSWAFDEY
jgi:hypothetical protein